MKRILQFSVTCLFSLLLIGCQATHQSSSLGTPSIHSVATNYLLVHGMCVGYLQRGYVSETQFQILSELDQQAKLNVVRVLTSPSSSNIKQAEYSLYKIIDFITVNQQSML